MMLKIFKIKNYGKILKEIMPEIIKTRQKKKQDLKFSKAMLAILH